MGMGDERDDARWRRPALGDHDVHDDGGIEVFATGTSTWQVIARPPSDEQVHAALSDQFHRTGAVVLDAVRHARDFHARPGHRPGRVTPLSASVRRGGGTDVVRPVLVDPVHACELAVSGRLFERPVEHLDVDLPGHRDTLTWDVVLTTGRHQHHPATLCLLASPSMVVTVIELVARRRVRRSRRRFVREGITAVEELARRLETSKLVSAA